MERNKLGSLESAPATFHNWQGESAERWLFRAGPCLYTPPPPPQLYCSRLGVEIVLVSSPVRANEPGDLGSKACSEAEIDFPACSNCPHLHPRMLSLSLALARGESVCVVCVCW